MLREQLAGDHELLCDIHADREPDTLLPDAIDRIMMVEDLSRRLGGLYGQDSPLTTKTDFRPSLRTRGAPAHPETKPGRSVYGCGVGFPGPRAGLSTTRAVTLLAPREEACSRLGEVVVSELQRPKIDARSVRHVDVELVAPAVQLRTLLDLP